MDKNSKLETFKSMSYQILGKNIHEFQLLSLRNEASKTIMYLHLKNLFQQILKLFAENQTLLNLFHEFQARELKSRLFHSVFGSWQ